MLFKRLLISSILILSLPYVAYAQTGDQVAAQTVSAAECGALETLLKTVSLAQDFHSEPPSPQSSLKLAELEMQLGEVSLNAIVPEMERERLSVETAAITGFLTQLELAAQDPNTSGIRASITPAFLSSLISLDNYWGCGDAGDAETFSTLEGEETAHFFGTASTAAQRETGPKQEPGTAQSVRHMGQSSGKTISRVASQSVRLSPDVTLALMIFGLVSLMGGVFLYFKRLEVYEAREARSLVHAPVTVRLDDVERDMMLVDISMNGAKIKHEQSLGGQEKLYIKIGLDWHSAVIRWQNDIFAGVSFKTALDEAALIYARNAALPK